MPPKAIATGSLILMALAGWAFDRAMAAVPQSRIADRRATAPQRLADALGGSLPRLPGLTRISPPSSSQSYPVDDPCRRNHVESNDICASICGSKVRHLK